MTRRTLGRLWPPGLAAVLLLSGAATWPVDLGAAKNGTVYVAVAGSDGQPVPGLVAANFAVRVAGHDQPVLSAEPASDPLSLILFVQVNPNDVALTRAAVRSVIDHVRRASPQSRVGLADGPGTPEMLAVTAQAKQLETAVGALYTEPDLGPLVERLPDLTALLAKEPTSRRIILSITPPGVTSGRRLTPDTPGTLRKAGCELWGIEVGQVGGAILDRDPIFEDLITWSGGRRAAAYGAALLDTVARQAADLFLSQYLVTFTRADAKGQQSLQVGVRGLPNGAQVFAPGWTLN
jgi:hypothetical protein